MNRRAISEFVFKRMHECVDEHGKAIVEHMDNRGDKNRKAIDNAQGKCDAYMEMAQFILDERMRYLGK